MRLTCEERSGSVVFRISDFEEKYRSVFELCFYGKDGGDYVKAFPAAYPHMDAVRRNFLEHGKRMFDQLGYFSEVPWPEALAAFARRASDAGLSWWLTGSCACCIRGIPLNPHDVDIMIDSADAARFADVFAESLIEPLIDTKGWLTKDFGVAFLGARVDIASDPAAILDEPGPIDCGPYARAHLEDVVWNGFAIKVPPLALHLAANERRGRTERAALIRSRMG